MNDEMFEQLERQLTSSLPGGPGELRDVVLGAVRGELRAQRWDRRLGRMAAVLLITGVGLNVAVGLNSANTMRSPLVAGPSQDALLQTAVTVAEATDVETGRQVLRQLAAWGGMRMTDEQLTVLDAALAARLTGGKDG